MGNIMNQYPSISKPLFDATKTGDLNVLKALIGDDLSLVHSMTPFGTLLHVAADKGHLPVVKYLVESGADVNISAGIVGGNPFASACAQGHIEIARFLYEHGSQIDVSKPSHNPLFAAIHGWHPDIVEYLISLGIDTKVSYSGETMKNMDAIGFAKEWGRTDIVKLLEVGR